MSVDVQAQPQAGAIRRIAQAWDDAWAARDATALASLFTEDGVWADPGLSAPIAGREGLRRYCQSTLDAFPDLEIRQEELLLDIDHPDRAATHWRFRGTLRNTYDGGGFLPFPIAPTGDRVDFTGVAKVRLRDGLLARVDQYADNATLQRQIGMLPPAGSRMERIMGRLQALGARRRMRRNGGT